MAKRELAALTIGDFRYVLRSIAIGLAAGLFLGFVGPFGTFQSMPLPRRMLYWVSMLLAGTLFVPGLYVLLRAWLSDRYGAFAYVPLTAVLGSFPATLMVVAVTLLQLGIAVDFDLQLYLLVLLITLPMVVIQHIRTEQRLAHTLAFSAAGGGSLQPDESSQAAEPVHIPPPSPIARPRLLDRLPGRLGEDILCLQMEDHYLRVHTALGQELILLRMRDAVAELDGLDGAQVHRSWWVARAAVAAWRRDGKAVTLRLVNGLDVPVARDRAPELRAAGWLR